MKTKINYPSLAILAALFLFASCQKDSALKTAAKTTTTAATSSATSIALASLAATATSSSDSVYMVNCKTPHSKKDTVAFSALPATIGTYLTANYAGYTFKVAYQITDSLKVAVNYIVVIKYNNAYVGLKFTTAGVFVSVLEQMAGMDLRSGGPGGPGFHPGGPFNGRDGMQKDTVALSALPTAITAFFTTTYPTDTLLHAFTTPDTTYVLISKDTVLYATNISATGKLIKRDQVEPRGGMHTPVAQSALLASITTYLTATYPGYVFVNAFADSNKSGVFGYDVFITVNSTNYIVNFSSAGTFVKAMVIH